MSSAPPKHDIFTRKPRSTRRPQSKQQATETLSAPLARILLVPASVLVILTCIAPLLYFVQYSFTPQGQGGIASITQYTLENYRDFLGNPAFRETLVRTLIIAFAATAVGVIIAIPVARWISTMSPKWRTVALIGTVFPMLVGDVIRAIGWASMVGYSGLIKSFLVTLGIVGEDADLQHNEITIVIAMASAIMPILVLILEATFEGINPDVERASQSLGVAPTPTFFKVVLPQAVPGLIASSSLILVMSVNTFSVPLLIGGNQVPMMAPTIYDTITQDNNWELGSAMATTLLIITLVTVATYSWFIRRQFDHWRTAS